ncbi:MAG: hypothetical protein R2764_15895 [Bacteroidales bacterium]
MGSFALQNKKTEIDLRAAKKNTKEFLMPIRMFISRRILMGHFWKSSPSVLQIAGYLSEESFKGRSIVDFFSNRKTHLSIAKKLLNRA